MCQENADILCTSLLIIHGLFIHVVINHVMDVRKCSWLSAQLVLAWITQVQLKHLITFHVVYTRYQ